MSALNGGSPTPEIRRVGASPHGEPALYSAVIGAVSGLEVLAVYLAVQGRLPAQVPDHFSISGAVNGSLPPLVLLLVTFAEIAGMTAIFAGILWWSVRSVPLALHFRGKIERTLLGLQAAITMVVIPVITGLIYVSAAGVVNLPGNELGEATNILGFLFAAVILGFAVLQAHHWTRNVPGSPDSGPRVRARSGIGGPIEMVCSSCGEHFQVSGVPLFTPHIGVGRVGSLYLRCPRCGERGWNVVLGRVAA
jgi:hypothetical protein